MSDTEPQRLELPELTAEGRNGQAVLVIGAGSSGTPAGLGLRFSRARVWSVATDQELEAFLAAAGGQSFDTVVVDGPALGPELSCTALVRSGSLVGPAGRIVVVVDRGLSVADAWTPGAGLVWHGIATLGDQPCAVLGHGGADNGAGAGRTDAFGRLATLAQALVAAERSGLATAGARAAAAARVRNRSEAALLDQLRSLAGELSAERARHERADEARRALVKRYEALEVQHQRLLASKLGRATTRYWRLRKALRRKRTADPS